MKIMLEELFKIRYLLLGIVILGFGLSFYFEGDLSATILGNIAGIIVVFTEFMMLGYSTETSIGGSEKSAVGKMVGGYFFRMAFIAVVFYAVANAPHISLVGFVLPLFYPRVAIYLSLLKRKKGGS